MFHKVTDILIFFLLNGTKIKIIFKVKFALQKNKYICHYKYKYHKL